MKRTISNGSLTAKALLCGTGTGLLVLAAGCVLAALALHRQMLPEAVLRYCAWVICAIGALAGCGAARRLSGSGSLPVSLCCALLLALCMGLLRLTLKGTGEWSWHGAVIVFAAGVCAALLGAGRGKRRR